MKRLQEIKDEIVSGTKFPSWEEYWTILGTTNNYAKMQQLSNELAKRYAAECIKASLELAKENTICFINSDDCGRIETEDYYNILELIESKNNIVLL